MKDEVQGRKEHNERVLSRMKGLQAQPSTPESDADPRNPNQRNDNAPIADSSEAGTGGAGGADMGDWTEPFSTLRDMWQEDECPNWPQVAGIIEQLCRRAYPDRSALSIGKSMAGEALRLLAAEDERQSKLHEILETIREQIRLSVAAEHRPDGLFKNIQDAVYAMRGRTPLMNDVAITAALSAPVWEPVARVVPLKNLTALHALLPPSPVEVDGKTFAYHDPKAAERLIELRSVFDALLAASPLYTHPPAPAVGAEDVARIIEPCSSGYTKEWRAAVEKANAILSLLSGQGGGK